jgi:hypothetical protein
MQKDVARLQLIADRFSKIGSVPKLEEEQLIIHLQKHCGVYAKASI